MSPMDRIGELARAVVDERINTATSKLNSGDHSTAEFLMKITGTSKADMAEVMLKDPMTWITAIVAYLNERDKDAA